MSLDRWRSALESTWRLDRTHAGEDTSRAYRLVQQAYPGSEIIGWPSGTRCGSWVAPNAWRVHRATLRAPDGSLLADASRHPLELWSGSPSHAGSLSLTELQPHLLSDPKRPEARLFHFRNLYRPWAPEWGFSLPHRVREALPPGRYEVEIHTETAPGQLEMLELRHRGEREESLLLLSHFDHPAMCNDGLTGCLAALETVARLEGRRTRYSYCALATIEIVGSVFWAAHRARPLGVKEALFVAAPGTATPLRLNSSAGAPPAIERALDHVLRHFEPDATRAGFRGLPARDGTPAPVGPGPVGNDEVAFEAPGIGIPCPSLMRFPLPTYHSDADDLASVDEAGFERTVAILLRAIERLEGDDRVEPTAAGLPCLSHPDLDLYVSPPAVSGVAAPPGSALERVLSRIPDAAQRDEIARSERIRFDRLSAHFFALLAAEDRPRLSELAERLDLPFALVRAYAEACADEELVRLRPTPSFSETDHE